MEVQHTAPSASQFVPLLEYQSQTPASFFNGPPILYHHSKAASLRIQAGELSAAPALQGLFAGAKKAEGAVNGSEEINGTSSHEVEEAMDEDQDEELEALNVDIWVTSEKFILHSLALSYGVSIPYPTISLHALQSSPPSLFLQLLAQAQTFDDHDPDATISLTIVPTSTSSQALESLPSTTEMDEEPREAEETQASALFTAISACANLHPDPASGDEDDEDGSSARNPEIIFDGSSTATNGIYPLSNNTDGGGTTLPPPMPGSGGWITAENMNDFFDEEGNWRGGEEFTESEVLGMPGGSLGEGAGNVRGRDVMEDANGTNGGGGADGDEVESEETKWRRTD